MKTTAQLQEKYRDFSTRDLLMILEKETDYRPEAIAAVKTELSTRNVSEADQTDAQAEVRRLEQLRASNMEFITTIRGLTVKTGERFLELFRAREGESFEQVRLINIAGVFFVILSLIQLWSGRWLIPTLIEQPAMFIDLYMVLYVVPVVATPLGTILFLMRKPIGWKILMVYLVYVATGALLSIGYHFIMDDQMLTAFTDVYRDPYQTSSLIQLVLYGGAAGLLYQPPVRELYGLDKKQAQLWMAVTGIVAVLIMYAMTGIF